MKYQWVEKGPNKLTYLLHWRNSFNVCLFLDHSIYVKTPDFPADLVVCIHINIMDYKSISFCINIQLIAIIYDYLETCYIINQKKSPNSSPKLMNISLNSTDITQNGARTLVYNYFHGKIAYWNTQCSLGKGQFLCLLKNLKSWIWAILLLTDSIR